MTEYLTSVHSLAARLPRPDARDLLEILLIAAVIYWLLGWLRGTSAMSLIRGIAIVAGLGLIFANLFKLTVLNWLLRNSFTVVLVAIPIVFQPEIRRALERVGRTGIRSWRGRISPAGMPALLALSAQELAQSGRGALLVLERDTGLEDYVETGVRVDALPSVPLIQSIFLANSPLHDGAVIVREGRIAAAACTLPLSDQRPAGRRGTRHRAALGISERTDAVAIVVSEESSEISVASNGRLLGPLSTGEVQEFLDELALRGRSGPAGPGTGTNADDPDSVAHRVRARV